MITSLGKTLRDLGDQTSNNWYFIMIVTCVLLVAGALGILIFIRTLQQSRAKLRNARSGIRLNDLDFPDPNLHSAIAIPAPGGAIGGPNGGHLLNTPTTQPIRISTKK